MLQTKSVDKKTTHVMFNNTFYSSKIVKFMR